MGRYFVQPVVLRDEKHIRVRGLDNFFEFPNVGMAEFEWGAIPKAATFMRKNISEMLFFPLQVHGHRAVALCLPKDKEEAEWFFREELRIGYQSMAALQLQAAYGLKEQKYGQPQVAWFSLQSDSTWVVCLDETVATLWKTALLDTSRPMYGALTDRGISRYYTKEDLLEALAYEQSYGFEKEHVFLQRVDNLKEATYLTYGASVVAGSLHSSYVNDIHDALCAKVEDPTLIEGWKQLPVKKEVSFHFELVEDRTQRHR